MKLLRTENETEPLRTFVDGAELVSCELALTELPRAIRRAAALDPALGAHALLAAARELFEGIALRPVDRPLLLAAGALAEPSLRALDAVHLAAALDVFPHDGFVGYDERQNAVARLAGLSTFAPGAPT